MLSDYIDPVKTTIAILKDWRDQEWKREHCREQVEEIETRLTSATAHLGSTPVSGGGGNRVEQALVVGISQKEIAERGWRQSKEYEQGILPAWERLTEDERYILTVRFIDHEEGDGIKRIMDRYYVSKREAYNMSSDAIERLAKLIFWRP